MNKMYDIKYLDRSVDIHPICRKQKREGETLYLLFYAPWDPAGVALVNELKDAQSEDGEPIYLINSFDTPDEPYTKFRVTSHPTLVTLGKYPRPRTETRLSQIYRHLGL